MTVYRIVGMVLNSTGIMLREGGHNLQEAPGCILTLGALWGGVLCFILHDPAYNIFVIDLRACSNV